MKSLVFLWMCFIALAVSGQNQGKVVVGGNFSLFTEKGTRNTDNISETTGKSTHFSLIPSIHYFITDSWSIGTGIGLEHTKILTRPGDEDKDTPDLYDKTNYFVLNPSAFYYLKLSEKFYYTPNIYLKLKLGKTKADKTKKKVNETNRNAVNIGVTLLNFEFRPIEQLGLGISCGDVCYVYEMNKNNPSKDESSIKNKTSTFHFSLQDTFSFAFRYYF